MPPPPRSAETASARRRSSAPAAASWRRPRAHPKFNSPQTRQDGPVLPTESLQGLGRTQRGGGVAAQEFEAGPPDERMSHRWGVAEFSGAPARRVDQSRRAFRLAQFPRCHGKAGQCQGPGVIGEAFPRLSVTFGVAGVERALAMGPRLEEIGGKETA